MGHNCQFSTIAKLFMINSIFVLFAKLASGLECYACDHQEGNNEKCKQTVKQCEPHQDVCTINIIWKPDSSWVPYGERLDMVTKDCDTRVLCEARVKELQLHCKRDWFRDWECEECCSGDMCNYYITLSASEMSHSLLLSMCLVAISLRVGGVL